MLLLLFQARDMPSPSVMESGFGPAPETAAEPPGPETSTGMILSNIISYNTLYYSHNNG